VITIKSEW